METCCLKCGKENPKIFKTKNGRLIMKRNVLNADLKSHDLLKNKEQKDYFRS